MVLAHTISLILFLAATVLVAALLSRYFESPSWGVAGAAVWALAPTQVSGLAWFSVSNIVLMTAAALGAMVAYEAAHDPPGGGGAQHPSGAAVARDRDSRAHEGRRWGLVAAAVLLYVIALASYEAAIVLPGLLILRDRLAGRRLTEKPALQTYAAMGLVAMSFVGLRAWVAAVVSVPNPGFSPMSAAQTMAASAYVVWDHLHTWLLPFGRQEILGTFVWGRTAAAPQLVAAWAVLAVLVLVAWLVRRRAPNVTFGLAWFFIAFLPTSNLVPLKSGPFGDYYLMLPSVGLALAFVAAVQVGSRRLREPAAGASWRKTAIVAGIAVAGAWRLATAAATPFWAEAWNQPAELFARSMLARPYAYRSSANLARLLMQGGNLDAAEQLARKASTQAAWYALSFDVLGDVANRRGRYRQAVAYYASAAAASPGEYYPTFAAAYTREVYLRDRITAETQYRRVIDAPLNPYTLSAALNLGQMLAAGGRPDDAIRVMESVVRRIPGSADLHAQLALAYEKTGNKAKARAHRAEATRLRR